MIGAPYDLDPAITAAIIALAGALGGIAPPCSADPDRWHDHVARAIEGCQECHGITECVCRKAMLPSEFVALGLALEALERPKAEERKRAGGDVGRAVQHGKLASRTGTRSQLPDRKPLRRRGWCRPGGLGRHRPGRARQTTEGDSGMTHIPVIRGARGRGLRSKAAREAKRAASLTASERRRTAKPTYHGAARHLVAEGLAGAEILGDGYRPGRGAA